MNFTFLKEGLKLFQCLLLMSMLILLNQTLRAQTLIVTKLLDTNDGSCDVIDCSLREAISQAVDGDTIQFSVSGTLILGGIPLVLDKQLTLDASGMSPVTLSGNNSSGVLEINSPGDVMLKQLIISDGKNHYEGGGILLNAGSKLVLENCTVSHNESTRGGSIRGGGGIANLGGTLTILNSTISGNAAKKNGGGILSRGYLTASTSTIIINSTITNNIAGNTGLLSQGGGIYQSNMDIVQLKNSIVAGNYTNISSDDCSGNIISLGHNLVGTHTGCPQTDHLIDPALVTTTVLQPLQAGGNGVQIHPLQPNSPAIDQGDNAAVVTLSPPIEFDQRGEPYYRITNGDGDNHAFVDIGAVEAPGTMAIYHSPDVPIGGTFNVGATKPFAPITKSFNIENLGNADLVLDNPNINSFVEFSIVFPNTFPTTVIDTQVITIQCKPLIAGPRTAKLRLRSNDPYRAHVTYQLTCMGTNTPLPGYGSSPIAPGGTLDFGKVEVSSRSTLSLDIEEVGEADLSINTLNLSGDSDFSILSPTTPLIVIPDGSGVAQSIVIQCTPTIAAMRTATLEVVTNESYNAVHRYNLTCQGIPKPPDTSCQIYGVQDGGLNNSLLFTVNPETLVVEPLSNYPGYDIEALDAHPDTNIVYAASGDDTNKPGHLYVVEQTGILTDMGSTGFSEIEALTFHPDGTLWGWAKGDGLISITPQINSTGTLVFPSDIAVEGLTWDETGTLLYAAQGTHLWVSDGQSIVLACELPGQTEALEILPGNLLLAGMHGKENMLKFNMIDLETCDIITMEETIVPYDDIEGIAWPTKACAN